MPDVLTTPIDVTKVATDPKVVGAVQRGLSSLGFLHGEIDGVAGEATAKAIRNFEVYYNYNVTGPHHAGTGQPACAERGP